MRNRLPGLAPTLVLGGLLLLGGAGALAQAEADRRLDAAIERLRGALGPDIRIEIGARRVDPVTGRATLSDVAIIERDGRTTIPEVILSDASETRIGRAELLRPRLAGGADKTSAEAARIVVAGLPLPPAGRLDPAALAFEALEAETLRIATPGEGTLRAARLSLAEWRPMALGSGRLEGLDWQAEGADPQTLRLGRVALEGLVLPLAGGAFEPTAFRARSATLENVSLRDPGRSVTLALGRLALRDWLPGRPAALEVQGVQMAAPAGPAGVLETSLARLEVAGVDAARTLEAVLQGRQTPDPLPGVVQRIAAEGLDAAWQGQTVFSLARLLSEGALEGGMLRGGLAMEGLRIAPPREQAGWLEALGYREMRGGLELRGSVPRDGGRLEVAPLRLGWDEAATLTLAGQFDNMPGATPEGAPVDQAAVGAALAEARLAGLTLTLRDAGLLGRVLAQQARDQRIPPARLREQWAQMALALPLPGAPPPRRGAPGAKDPAPAAEDPLAPLRQALAAFIRQPGTLEIALRPAKPLPIGDIQALAARDPAGFTRLLGLSATAR